MKNWEKKSLIAIPTGMGDWAKKGGLQPTPVTLEDRVRVFAGFRDSLGVSRIGYIDLSLDNPTQVIGFSKDPVFDIGQDGAFDDNGVVPSAVFKNADGSLDLHYAGYQLHTKTRFSVFGGLALSKDNGVTFKRFKKTPLLERNDEDLLFRVAHSVLFEDGRFRVWYGGGDHFRIGAVKTLPFYDIRYMESPDARTFPSKGCVVLETTGDQHRLGRPYVIKVDGQYFMFYGEGSEAEPYRLAYASSTDAKNWKREGRLNISGDQTWDSSMSAYPALIYAAGKQWLIYNGDSYGDFGFIVSEKKA